MKKTLRLLYAALALVVGWQAQAQGLTCATALPVTPGTFTASTLIGTPSTPGLNGNNVALTAGWYSFTPTSNGILNINSCGGGSDTRLWVWSGTCAALTPVANNDDFAGCFSTGTIAYASKIENIIVTTGNTYYFEWDNQWEATGFTWNFTFTALPMNNDAGITNITNRYTRIPITQASAGIPFGATVNNFSGSALTNVVLTTEIYELPNTTTPVQTLASTATNLAIGASQVISCGTWSPSLTSSKSYLVKYVKTQTQVDGVTSNDVTTQNLTLDYNYYARDNNIFLTGYNWSSTNFTWKQGNYFNFYGADNVTGVSYFVASTSTTQAYNILVYSVTNGVPSNNPVYTGPSITANGSGWRFHTFTTPLPVTAGSEFLFVVNHVGPATAGGFPLGVSSATHTAGKSVIKVGTGAWISTETYGVNVVFMMRPKFGSDPTDEIAFLNNRNPGGENTRIHTRQSLSGNDLQFWARGVNLGTSTVNGVTMTVTVKDAANNTVYTATSAAQDLIAGQVDTFTVANHNVTALGTYTIDYVFNNPGDQIPQNNTKTTTFVRTTGEMSRTVGITGSLGLNATTVANNIVFGNNYTLTQNDFLDSVQFVLNPGTPVGYVASVNIYGTTLNPTTGAMVPNATPIASTVTYTTTAADNLNGAVIKLPVSGGSLSLTPGTYFVGVYQASSSNGNIRLATSTDYSSSNMVYYRWDQANGGNWQSPASINYSFVVNPIFKSCVAYNQTVSTTAASCGANDGAATVSTTGGTGTINFAWANGNTTATISNVAAGQYGLTLSDINGCPLTFNVVVPSQSNLTVSATTQDVTCGGQSTGGIVLNASQGVTPYVYSWANNLGSSATLSNIPAGTYQVTVTDATGCIVIYNDTIVELSNLNGTMSGTDVLCNNAQTGNLEISAASGVAPYTYQWIGTNNTSTYVTSVGPGTYTCVVTDGLGCTDTVVTVLAVSNIAATASASNPLCYGTNTGSVTVSATGGTGPYSYDWAGSTVSSATLSGLGEGAYSCVVTDSYGCSTSASANVAEPAAWSVSAAVTPAIWGTDGAIDLSVNGATGPYTYSWSNNATTEDLNNLDGDDYIVTITDASGCTYTDTITVESLVGLDAQELAQTVVYPNPSRGNVFVVGSAVEQIVMFNQMGQAVAIEVQTLGNGAFEVITNNVATGSYILELRGAQDITRKALQIIK